MADINIQLLATPLLLGHCRQLVKADLDGREFALEAEADFVSLLQVGVGGQDGPMLECGLRADFPVVSVGFYLEDGRCNVVRAGRDPGIDVVVCALLDGEHVIVLLTAYPLGGCQRSRV